MLNSRHHDGVLIRQLNGTSTNQVWDGSRGVQRRLLELLVAQENFVSGSWQHEKMFASYCPNEPPFSNPASISEVSHVLVHLLITLLTRNGWLGRAMVLGNFQSRGVQLLWHMVGQGPAVLAAGAGWVVFVLFFFISSILSSFSNELVSLKTTGQTEILWSRPYNLTVIVSYYRRRAR